MIRPQRIVHRWIFVILAFVVCAVLILAVALKPEYPVDALPEAPRPVNAFHPSGGR